MQPERLKEMTVNLIIPIFKVKERFLSGGVKMKIRSIPPPKKKEIISTFLNFRTIWKNADVVFQRSASCVLKSQQLSSKYMTVVL